MKKAHGIWHHLQLQIQLFPPLSVRYDFDRDNPVTQMSNSIQQTGKQNVTVDCINGDKTMKDREKLNHTISRKQN